MNSRRPRLGLLVASIVLAGSITTTPGQSNVAQSIRYGTVVSVERTVVMDKPTGTGATVGATAGAVAGYALAESGNRWLGGLLGGVLGGAAGRAVERSSRKRKGWQLIVKIDEGEEIGVQIPGKKQKHHPGDRVRLMTGPGGQTQVTVIEE
jgi:outer membrane lipoprotein SlyB